MHSPIKLDDLDVPAFKKAKIIELFSLDRGKLTDWLKRGLLKPQGQMSSGTRAPFLFSLSDGATMYVAERCGLKRSTCVEVGRAVIDEIKKLSGQGGVPFGWLLAFRVTEKGGPLEFWSGQIADVYKKNEDDGNRPFGVFGVWSVAERIQLAQKINSAKGETLAALPRLFSESQVAQYFQIPVEDLAAERAAGKISFNDVRGQPMYSVTDVNSYLDQCKVSARPLPLIGREAAKPEIRTKH